MPTPQIKDERTYQALRREGNSEEIGPDRQRGRQQLAQGSWRPRRQEPEVRGVDEEQLAERAREIGIKGRSSMSKPQLISALRNH